MGAEAGVVLERESDALGSRREGRIAKEAPHERVMTIEAEREIGLSRRHAIEARKEVRVVPHDVPRGGEER